MSRYLDWKVGDRVVCIDGNGSPALREGREYTICGFYPKPGFCPTYNRIVEFGVFVEGAEPLYAGGFAPMRFRKVQPRKTDISIFTAMLNDAEQKVDC